VSAVDALARIAVGVIVERRKAQSSWVDFTWKPVSVLVGVPDASPWTSLSQDEDGVTFYAGAAEIALYRTETTNYRDNLAGGEAKLWVALRPTGGEPPYEIFAVTADPAEGEAWSETGSDLVEAVAMPAAVQTEIAGFIAAHHVERPFYKRQRDNAQPQALPRKGSLRKAPQ
jgi:Protein of unknown function (DUF3305)